MDQIEKNYYNSKLPLLGPLCVLDVPIVCVVRLWPGYDRSGHVQVGTKLWKGCDQDMTWI